MNGLKLTSREIGIGLIGLLAFSAHAWAESSTLFHPLVTMNARTIRHNSFALGLPPLGNLSTHFSLSSVNVGLFNRLEVGTVPVFYLVGDHQYNFVTKLNFYRGDTFDWLMSYGRSVFRSQFDNFGKVDELSIVMQSYQWVANYHPSASMWALGVSGSLACGKFESNDPLFASFLAQSGSCNFDYGVDVQINTSERQWLTLGHSKMREQGLTPYDTSYSGLGLAYTWFLPGKLISRPSFGVYKHLSASFVVTFTTTFYEEQEKAPQ